MHCLNMVLKDRAFGRCKMIKTLLTNCFDEVLCLGCAEHPRQQMGLKSIKVVSFLLLFRLLVRTL